jgi:adenine-specific DNA-methyltransferase
MVSTMKDEFDFVARSLSAGRDVLATHTQEQRKRLGQFLTPPPVARYMARQLGPLQDGDRILDPAIGSGVLACAVVERAIAATKPLTLHLDGYEIDPDLAQAAREVLTRAAEVAACYGIMLHARVHERDFILERAPMGPLFDASGRSDFYDHVIANPPYFKLNQNDPRVHAVAGLVNGSTNIYTLFMALSLRLLNPSDRDGPSKRACFIVPRSFCSGAYFAAFRRDFVRQAVPIAVHIFDSREEVFERGDVLQENIILTFRSRMGGEDDRDPQHVFVSTSHSATDLDVEPGGQEIPFELFLGKRNGASFFRLPTDEMDRAVVETMDSWRGLLDRYGLEVSTGPVVAFRARPFLSTDVDKVQAGQAVPLLWMQNVQAQTVEWPVTRGNKPQAILLQASEKNLLVPLKNYVLLRRFSAKEERRRLVAAPLLPNDLDCPCHQIGLENHLNYVYRRDGDLTVAEVVGLSALFNSAFIDRYFRVVNGNTQVNATDLRALPLPPMEVVERIGEQVLRVGKSANLDSIVFSILRDANLVPDLVSCKGDRDYEQVTGGTGRFAGLGATSCTAERDLSPHPAGAGATFRGHTVE